MTMQRPRPTACLLATVLAALGAGCIHPPRSDRPPVWRLLDAAPEMVGCAELDAWIAKSGREGVGVTVSLRAHSTPCSVTLDRALVTIAGGAEHAPARLPGGTIVLGSAPLHFYLPFPFDNLQEWRRGARQGELALTLTVVAAAPSGPAALPAATIRRPMDQRPRETWQADTDAFYGFYRKTSCALLGWEGGDGGGQSFRAALTVETKEPSCATTVESAVLLTEREAGAMAGFGAARPPFGAGGLRQSPAAAGVPRSFALTKGRTAYLVLDFPLPPDVASERRLLHLVVRDAGGALFSFDWPLALPDPFRLMRGRSMPWR